MKQFLRELLKGSNVKIGILSIPLKPFFAKRQPKRIIEFGWGDEEKKEEHVAVYQDGQVYSRRTRS